MKLIRPKLGVGSKTMGAFTLVFWIPLLLLIVMLYLLFHNLLDSETANTSRVYIQSIEDVFNENPKLLKGILAGMVKNEKVQEDFNEKNRVPIQNLLIKLSKINPYSAIAIAVDENLKIITNKSGKGQGKVLDIGKGLSDVMMTGKPLYTTELVSGEFLIEQDVDPGRIPPDKTGLVQFVIHPVSYKDRVEGAVILGILISGDPEIANRVYKRLGVEMALFAGSHIESFSLHSSPTIPRNLWALGEQIPGEIKNEVTFGRSFFGNIESSSGMEFYAAFKPVKDSRDRIVGAIGLSLTGLKHKDNVINNLLIGSGVSAVIGLFIAMGLAYLTHKDIIRPILLIQKAMDSFGEGEKNARVALETGDEFEKLAEGFNSMADGISRREARLQKHYEVTKLLMSTLNFDDLISKILKVVLEVTESNMGIVYLVDEKKENLIPRAQIGTQKDVSELDIKEGYPGIAYEQKKYILINLDENYSSEKIELGAFKAIPRQMAFIPVIYSDEVMGVLVLGRLKEYSAEDTMLFEYLAGQVSIALDNAILHKKVQELSITDNLTNLNNRHYLNKRLDEIWNFCVRHKQDMSIILADLDNFKKINDTYGHDKGDEVLKAVAGVFKTSARIEDVVARYGGEEFVVVLSNTDESHASEFARRILESVRELKFAWNDYKKITLSIGIASYPNNSMKEASELVRAADMAMYASKTGGKDRFSVYKDENNQKL
ncbi:MAG: diguanylate cyclase [Spirochaetia bacterium]|nr:diguanylate cyclase [Spirochaetia bacterium]